MAVKVDSHGVVGPLLLEPAHHIVDFHDGRLRVSESLVGHSIPHQHENHMTSSDFYIITYTGGVY